MHARVDDCRKNTCVDVYRQRSVTSPPALWKSHTLKAAAVGRVGNVFNAGFILKTIPICQNLKRFFLCFIHSFLGLPKPFFSSNIAFQHLVGLFENSFVNKEKH